MSHNKNKHIVLFVDDESQLLKAIKRVVRHQPYKSLYAEGGQQALAILERQSVQVIVSNLQLPEMDGLALLQHVQKRYPEIIRIVLSGVADIDPVLEAIHVGRVYRYITKPYNDRELLSTINQALDTWCIQQENRDLLSQLSEQNCMLERQVKELAERAIEDPLTGLFNRGHLHKCLSGEIERSVRHNHSFLAIMADIDHFKKINDCNGHLFGDLVLKRLARLFEDNLRNTDKIFRYGGEEFFLLLTETNMDLSVTFCRRMLDIIRRQEFSYNGQSAKVTVSMGAAEFPQEAKDIPEIIGLADCRLYKAKQAGRDRFDHGLQASWSQPTKPLYSFFTNGA